MQTGVLDVAVDQLENLIFPDVLELVLALAGQLVGNLGLPPKEFDHANHVHSYKMISAMSQRNE